MLSFLFLDIEAQQKMAITIGYSHALAMSNDDLGHGYFIGFTTWSICEKKCCHFKINNTNF